MSVGEKRSGLLGRGREREGKNNQGIFSVQSPLGLAAEPWNWQEGIILFRNALFLLSLWKSTECGLICKPLKNCCRCEFTATWDGKELPDGLRSVPCNSDVYRRCPGPKAPQTILECAPANPWPPDTLLSCSVTPKTRSMRWNPLHQFSARRKQKQLEKEVGWNCWRSH